MSQEPRCEAPRKKKRRSKDDSDEPVAKRSKSSSSSAETDSKSPTKVLLHSRKRGSGSVERVGSWSELSGLCNFGTTTSLSAVPLSQLYHGSFGGGEPESGDSDTELLGEAGAWTEEEATILYRSKLYRLQQLYLSQCSRLRHILHIHRRQYLQRIESINDGNLTAESDFEPPLTNRDVDYAAAIRRYRRRFGHDAVLRLRLIERRREATVVTSRTGRRTGQSGERRSCTSSGSEKPAICMHMVEEKRCTEPCLPVTRYCSQHICFDTAQKLFVSCRKVLKDNSVCGRPLPAYIGKPPYLCALHADLPEINLEEMGKRVERLRALHEEYVQKREAASTAMTIAAAARCVANENGISSNMGTKEPDREVGNKTTGSDRGDDRFRNDDEGGTIGVTSEKSLKTDFEDLEMNVGKLVDEVICSADSGLRQDNEKKGYADGTCVMDVKTASQHRGEVADSTCQSQQRIKDCAEEDMEDVPRRSCKAGEEETAVVSSCEKSLSSSSLLECRPVLQREANDGPVWDRTNQHFSESVEPGKNADLKEDSQGNSRVDAEDLPVDRVDSLADKAGRDTSVLHLLPEHSHYELNPKDGRQNLPETAANHDR